MDKASPPRLRDQAARHVSTHREVHVQPVPRLVPLGHPHVRERVASQPGTQRSEELAHVGAHLARVVTPVTGVGQRPRRFSRFAAQHRRNIARARRPASCAARPGSAAWPRATYSRMRREASTKQPPASPSSGTATSTKDERKRAMTLDTHARADGCASNSWVSGLPCSRCVSSSRDRSTTTKPHRCDSPQPCHPSGGPRARTERTRSRYGRRLRYRMDASPHGDWAHRATLHSQVKSAPTARPALPCQYPPDMATPFSDVAMVNERGSTYSSTSEDAWVLAPCAECDGRQMAVLARTHDNTAAWLRCVSCRRPYVVNNGELRPSSKPLSIPTGLVGVELDAWKEARECLGVGAYTAAVMMCRKILFHMAVREQMPPKNSKGKAPTFVEVVKHLEDSGIFTARMRPWVDRIKDVGNEANHEIVPVSREAAMDVARFTEQLLRLAYEMDYLISAAQAENGSSTAPDLGVD